VQHNKIEDIADGDLHNYHELEHLDVDSNQIVKIGNGAFKSNKKLKNLVFDNNPLVEMENEALKPIHSLERLKLKNTMVSKLPNVGIGHLTKLDIRNTKHLFTIPDPNLFSRLKTVQVMYSMHCCAFQAERERRKLNNTRKCENADLEKAKENAKKKRSKQEVDPFAEDDPFSDFYGEDDFTTIIESNKKQNETEKKEALNPCKILSKLTEVELMALQSTLDIECSPEPDAFNPCQDVMGTHMLRACSWFISIFAILGNAFQLVILFHNRQELTVYKLLMYNLGFANLLMGFYLFTLCCVDAVTYGEYYNHVRMWQYNGGCQTFGFLAVFSTQLSLLSLVLITIERYLLIIFALQVQYQMKIRHAKIAVACSWVYSLIMALLPATGLASSYTRVAICLPFDTPDDASIGFVLWMLIAYVIAFIQIVFCYTNMFHSIADNSNVSSAPANIDYQVAKRMALIIFSNFLCWLPISGTGILALFSKTLMLDVSVAKFLLVFIFPLNACTNPFLYAIFTKVYRGDMLRLLSRVGLCRDAEREYGRRSGSQNSGNGSIRRGTKKRSETGVSFRTHFEYNDTYRSNRLLPAYPANQPISEESKFLNKTKPQQSEECRPQNARLDGGSSPESLAENGAKMQYACVSLSPGEVNPALSALNSDNRVKTRNGVRLVVDDRNDRMRTDSNATCSTDRSYKEQNHLMSEDEYEDPGRYARVGYSSRQGSRCSYNRQDTSGSRASSNRSASNSLEEDSGEEQRSLGV